MQKNSFHILVLALISWLFIACSEEHPVHSFADGDATIQFSMHVPPPPASAFAQNGTRAGTVANQAQYETTVNNTIVLVFRNAAMVQAVDGVNVSGHANRFKITTRSGSESVKFYLLANTSFTADNLGKTLYGKSPHDVRAALADMAVSVNAHGLAAPFAFWGEFDMPAGLPPSTEAAPTQVTGVKMLRAAARAIVTKNVDDATFVVTSAAIYRMSSALRVIPAAVNAAMQVTAPTLSTAATPLAPVNALDASSLPLTYYLAESAASPSLDASVTAATCLVIGGRFGNSPVETYYRIDFEKDDNNDGNVDRVGEILRNHSYSFIITSVSAPGWKTPDEAANNRPTGLRVEVKDWEDKHLEAFKNNEYVFTISSREMLLTGASGSENYADISTNAPNVEIKFKNSSSSSNTSIENNKVKVSLINQGSGNYRIIAVAKTENVGNAELIEEISVVASNLIVDVSVKQKIADFISAATTYMFVTSDGTNPSTNIISASKDNWRVHSTPNWISYIQNGDELTLTGAINRTGSLRTGVVELRNNTDMQLFITVRQAHWVEWTKADLMGGTHLGDFTASETGVEYVSRISGRPWGFATNAGDVNHLFPKRKSATADPPNYQMRGDMYRHNQVLIGISQINSQANTAWRLASEDELRDLFIRFQLTPTMKTRFVKNPDGSTVYFPDNGLYTGSPESPLIFLQGEQFTAGYNSNVMVVLQSLYGVGHAGLPGYFTTWRFVRD